MPTYNGERYIREQLESILSQLDAQDEVILSDDRSTDRTLAVVSSLNDRRIKVYIHPETSNPFKGSYRKIYTVYKNVEYALSKAAGDYIFLADQDDVWLPNKVDRVTKEFELGAEVVLHNNQVVDMQGNVLVPSYFSWSKPSRSTVRFIVRCFYQGASMAFNRRIKELSLPFPDKWPVSHDHWIAAVGWTHGKNISFIHEPLLLYRRHGQNVSYSSEHSSNSLYFKISYRFNLLALFLVSKKR